MRCVQQLSTYGHITLRFLSVIADKAAIKLPCCFRLLIFPSTYNIYSTYNPCLISTTSIQLFSRFLLSLSGSILVNHKRWNIKISKVEWANITQSLGSSKCLFYWTEFSEYFKVSIHGEQRELSTEIEICNKVGMEEKRPAALQGAAGEFIWATYSIIVNRKSEKRQRQNTWWVVYWYKTRRKEEDKVNGYSVMH